MRLLWDHMIFFIRGCRHPIMEQTDAWVMENDTIMTLSVCTVCGTAAIGMTEA